ncbi:hypothetical protein ACVII1_007444 [Bradyrhizobium elkanii]
MSDQTSAPRRRSRFGLYAVPVAVLIAAVAWSAFWFFAASQVGVQADALARAGGEGRPGL